MGPRRQRHRAICRTRAARAGASVARRARGDRDLRHRQSEPQDRAAKTVEIGLRRPRGQFRFEATAYYTRFSELHLPQPHRRNLRRRRHHLHRRAVLRRRRRPQPGDLFAARRDLPRRRIPEPARRRAAWNGIVRIENQFDVVRATFTDGTNVPRIRRCAWRWRVLARCQLAGAHQPAACVRQNDIAAVGETTTNGYNLLKAELGTPRRFADDFGARVLTVGIAGNNLLNDDIRNQRFVQEGRSADAGPRRALLRDAEEARCQVKK